MSMRKTALAAAASAALLCACVTPQESRVGGYGLGKPATQQEIAGWNIDVRADGAGLPPGSGSVAQGKQIYEARCAACHGANGEKGPAPRLVGGKGSLATATPVMTVGSYWPYASTLYDYINRAMPFDRPQSLTADEVYAVTAYTLHLNGIVGTEAVLDKVSLPKVKMPNAAGFVFRRTRAERIP
jgi:mono/diheme cytochrome c family protein